jgi:hypothetical protein
VVFDLIQKMKCFEIGKNHFARIVPIHAAIFLRGFIVERGRNIEHIDLRKSVPLPDPVIIRIMRGCYLHHARSE